MTLEGAAPFLLLTAMIGDVEVYVVEDVVRAGILVSLLQWE